MLKHDDTFVVFDHLGNVKSGGLGEEGLYHEGTRYLSCLVLELDGLPPFFLGSSVRDENDQLSVALTNPDRIRDGRVEVPLGTLHLAVRTFLWQGACHWRLGVGNHWPTPVEASVRLRFLADFADIYEVRGMKRKARGRDLPPEVAADRVVLGYVGLDGEWRRTLLRFALVPAELTADQARFVLSVRPREGVVVDLTVACWRAEAAPEPLGFGEAHAAAEAALERLKTDSCRVRASDGRFDAWLRRAESDLHMMTSDLPTGPYPYAGVPWFNTPFGRDVSGVNYFSRLASIIIPGRISRWLLSRGGRLAGLLSLLRAVARHVQFQDHAVMYQTVDRRRRHHRVLEDRLPTRERQVARQHHAPALIALGQEAEQHLHLVPALLHVAQVI